MSESRFSPGARRLLIPVLDWRSGRTWRVFVGLAIVVGAAFSIVVIIFGAVVDRLIDGHTPRFIVKLLIGYPTLFGLAAIGGQALRRVMPLRNIEGEIVTKQSVSNLGVPALWPLPAAAWALCFLAVFTGAMIPVRTLGWAFTEGFPLWEMSLTGMLSIIVFDLPVRVLWRVPGNPENSPIKGVRLD